MSSRQKQTLIAVIGVIALLGLGIATVVVIPRLTQEAPIAPTAPESKPAASNEWLGAASCNLSFAIAAEPTPSVSLTPTLTPTATPTLTPTPTITMTPTPTTPGQSPTPTTPGSTFLPTPSSTPSATVATLPEAGISLPTLGALGGGIVMILLGILLAL